MTVAEKERDGVGKRIGNEEVRIAVGIEISRGDSDGALPVRQRDCGGWEKSPIAIAEQDGDAVAGKIGDGDVGVAVEVEVADNDSGRFRADGIGLGSLKSAVAITQKDLHVVGSLVDDGEIHRRVLRVAVTERKAAGATATGFVPAG